ncbi:SRPBCC domain-containing protein [Actinosynnema pretiosum subsp. pretiosum]|uniref:Activator of Hsp90 ATPase 1 family protein n=2 Tax=Actinosynnema TaxID=40566 RepID=C6WII5_ACTMD|nr:SRPBCC domain-containing protein [Actinosynnema mirum]ACU36228.1 Activator of Hsp90 ATPase 1 family protein [Actinosynnema mirum DSM 43827]QUF06092.1 SRPBCC domain-containing protein [Actinosynnema pretiosum subsp. pretiosum]
MTTTRVQRTVRAPRAAVYRALLDGEAVGRWMVPNGMSSEVRAFDAREGGEFRISLTYDDPSTTAGKTSDRVDSYGGRFTRLVQDTEVVQVVEFDTDDPDTAGEMVLTFTLVDVEGGTQVTGVHENVPPSVRPEDNEHGWTMSLGKLAALVEEREQERQQRGNA